jgi:predicted nucleic acid-binding protein
MRVLDTSAIIYGWDNYPLIQFPGLWLWLGTEIRRHELTIPTVALEEVEHMAPEFAKWLKATGVHRLPMTESVVLVAMSIKHAIGVVNDQFHPKGVDENDLLIIAAAKVAGAEVVTNEARQFGSQAVAKKRKIPAVCDMPLVGVGSMSFLELLQKSMQVF